MIYSIRGTLLAKREHDVVVETGGIGFRVFVPKTILASLPDLGTIVTFFCMLYVRQDALELYGCLSAKELELFERLISVSGVGPKSAFGIMGVAPVDQLVAAINAGRIELLTRVSGVGKKTAERVVLELKGKLSLMTSPQLLTLMESDMELEETLVGLGYSRSQAKAATLRIDPKILGFKERLKEALRKAK